jgi:hypothetical protein
MVEEATTIEDNLLDTLFLGTLGQKCSDLLCQTGLLARLYRCSGLGFFRLSLCRLLAALLCAWFAALLRARLAASSFFGAGAAAATTVGRAGSTLATSLSRLEA